MEAGSLCQCGGQLMAYRPPFSFAACPLRDAANNAADGVDVSVCVEQRKLLNDARVSTVFLKCGLLKFHRNACLEHLSIVGLKRSSLFRGKYFIVRLAFDVSVGYAECSVELIVYVQIS